MKKLEKYLQPLPMPVSEPLKSEPWLRWKQETALQYEAFTIYRNLPPKIRSLSRTAYIRRKGPPPDGASASEISTRVNPTMESRWSTRYRWKDRVEAFDAELERGRIREMQKGQLDAYREMGDRHAREAVALQAKAVARLQRLDPDELSAAEVRQFIVAAATLERLSRGASIQDMAEAQKVANSGRPITARIEYVDDWRGDRERLERLRSQNSRYGSGQGLLPQDLDDEHGGVTPVRADGSPLPAEGKSWLGRQLDAEPGPTELQVPEAP
jgi:hypothetical protein